MSDDPLLPLSLKSPIPTPARSSQQAEKGAPSCDVHSAKLAAITIRGTSQERPLVKYPFPKSYLRNSDTPMIHDLMAVLYDYLRKHLVGKKDHISTLLKVVRKDVDCIELETEQNSMHISAVRTGLSNLTRPLRIAPEIERSGPAATNDPSNNHHRRRSTSKQNGSIADELGIYPYDWKRACLSRQSQQQPPIFVGPSLLIFVQHLVGHDACTA